MNGKQLAIYRYKKGVYAKDVAEIMGISKSAISAMERMGRANITEVKEKEYITAVDAVWERNQRGE